MLNKVLLLFLVLISLNSFGQLEHSGQAFKGIQRAKDESGKYWLVNKHDVKIISLDSVQLNVGEVINELQNSSLSSSDKLLISRIVSMHGNESARLKELLNIAKTYTEIDRIIMENYHNKLVVLYGKRKLKKLLNKKH